MLQTVYDLDHKFSQQFVDIYRGIYGTQTGKAEFLLRAGTSDDTTRHPSASWMNDEPDYAASG